MHFMRQAFLKSTVMVALAAGLVGCVRETDDEKFKKRAQYWQRVDVSNAAHMQGPKAQTMLNRRIASCMAEVRELKRLGLLRDAVPAANKGGVPPDPDTPEGKLAQWDSPQRYGPVRMEHKDFHDFESCMHNHGWERVEYMPKQRKKRARDDYIKGIVGQDKLEKREEIKQKRQQRDDNFND
jgi:hypothetical protein